MNLSKLTPLVSRITRSKTATQAIQRRGMAGDAHGEVKYNAWEKPTQISEWKEEHIVFAVLAGWGIVIYGSLKAFGGKKEEVPAAPAS